MAEYIYRGPVRREHPTEKLIRDFKERLANEDVRYGKGNLSSWEQFLFDWNTKLLSEKEMLETYFCDEEGNVDEKEGKKVIHYLVHISGELSVRPKIKRIELGDDVIELIIKLRNTNRKDRAQIINEISEAFPVDRYQVALNVDYLVKQGQILNERERYDKFFLQRLVEVYSMSNHDVATTIAILKKEFPNIHINNNMLVGLYYRNKI